MVMAQSRNNGMPAYQKIQRAIRLRIESRHLKPGDAVSSERELAKLHGVSLMTARHALAGLEREGIVERRPGASTFVAPPRIHFNKLMSYTEQMASRGLPPSSKVIATKIVEDEPEIAARLGLAATSRMVKMERVRNTGDEPFALETCYLPADDFGGLSTNPLTRGSLFTTLENDYDCQLAYADEEVDATVAEGRVAHLLNLKPGVPLLRMRQVIYSTKTRPVIYVVGFYRSERHSLFIRRLR
jgi:GntR family transcriptional regulator